MLSKKTMDILTLGNFLIFLTFLVVLCMIIVGATSFRLLQQLLKTERRQFVVDSGDVTQAELDEHDRIFKLGGYAKKTDTETAVYDKVRYALKAVNNLDLKSGKEWQDYTIGFSVSGVFVAIIIIMVGFGVITEDTTIKSITRAFKKNKTLK
jgi:uncharacterized membrane protein